LSIDNETGNITISNYGGADPDILRNLTIKVGTWHNFSSITPTAFFQFSIVENASYEINEPPYFEEDPETVELEVVIGGDNPSSGEQKVVLPAILDVNGDSIEPLSPSIIPS